MRDDGYYVAMAWNPFNSLIPFSPLFTSKPESNDNVAPRRPAFFSRPDSELDHHDVSPSKPLVRQKENDDSWCDPSSTARSSESYNAEFSEDFETAVEDIDKETWGNEDSAMFEDICYGKTLMAQVSPNTMHAGCLSLWLYECRGTYKVNLNKELVDKGMAKFSPNELEEMLSVSHCSSFKELTPLDLVGQRQTFSILVGCKKPLFGPDFSRDVRKQIQAILSKTQSAKK